MILIFKKLNITYYFFLIMRKSVFEYILHYHINNSSCVFDFYGVKYNLLYFCDTHLDENEITNKEDICSAVITFNNKKCKVYEHEFDNDKWLMPRLINIYNFKKGIYHGDRISYRNPVNFAWDEYNNYYEYARLIQFKEGKQDGLYINYHTKNYVTIRKNIRMI